MSEEDQERFEDYLELERYLEEFQAGHAAHPPEGLTPSQARIYRMAALFRSASPGETTPRAEIATALQARLEQKLQQAVKNTRSLFSLRSEPVSHDVRCSPGELLSLPRWSLGLPLSGQQKGGAPAHRAAHILLWSRRISPPPGTL